MLWLLSLLTLIVESSSQTTLDSQTNALNNLAALESAEEILKTIDDLTTSVTPATSIPVTTTETFTEVATTKLDEVTTNVLEDGRRAGSGVALPMQAIYNTDSGLRALMEIKRRMQSFQKIPTVYPAPNVFTYGAPGQPLYLNNNAFQPEMEVARPPSYMYNPPVQQGPPLQYAKYLQTAYPEYANIGLNIRKGNVMNVIQYSQIPQKTSVFTVPSQLIQKIRPAQNIPQTTPIPMWMLLALQEMQGGRPMDSPSVEPQLAEHDLYDHNAPLATVDSPDVVEAAFQEANANPMNMAEWQQPQPSFPTLYIPPLTEAPPIATRIRTVSLPPLTIAPRLPKKTRLVNRQLPLVTGRLPVNPLLPADAWMSLQALAPVNSRLVTQPRPSTLRMVLNYQSRLAPRLPAKARNRFSLVTANKKPPAESLLKLSKFMRENRDTLLQFIAMKRNLLLDQKKGTIAQGNALMTQIRAGGKMPPNRALIQNRNEASANVLGEKKQALGVKGPRYKGGVTKPVAQPVARALPPEIPGHMLDIAPGRGHVWHMRFKDRICQRNVMLVSGPKYDRKARVIQREFRPGVDRRIFRVTKRRKMLLPACCNCCKKSVLGCE